MIKPYYEQDGITIFLGDCREILPHLPKVDLVLTDPPYGLADKHNGGGGGLKSTWKHKQEVAKSFDMERPSKEYFDLMLQSSANLVIWGGNYFADLLPPSMGWLVWDKCLHGFSTSDFEMAWTNRNYAARRIEYACGNERGFAPKSNESKLFINCHPTQKPIAVMEWCIELFPSITTICDPFMGSGTTLRAAKNLGRKAIGIEIEEKYCEIAVKRLAQGVLPL